MGCDVTSINLYQNGRFTSVINASPATASELIYPALKAVLHPVTVLLNGEIRLFLYPLPAHSLCSRRTPHKMCSHPICLPFCLIDCAWLLLLNRGEKLWRNLGRPRARIASRFRGFVYLKTYIFISLTESVPSGLPNHPNSLGRHKGLAVFWRFHRAPFPGCRRQKPVAGPRGSSRLRRTTAAHPEPQSSGAGCQNRLVVWDYSRLELISVPRRIAR